jgi:hypothetical protein
MDKPDFAFCFKAAMLQAARTNDADKQAILARLVTERLSSGEESLLSIIIQQSCECTGMLTNNQLRILALCTWIRLLSVQDRWVAQTIRDSSVGEHLLPTMRRLAPMSKVSVADFLHLSGASCVHIAGGINAVDPLNWLTVPSEEWGLHQKESILHLLDEFGTRHQFTPPVILTYKGLVVGACACDILTGGATDLRTLLE